VNLLAMRLPNGDLRLFRFIPQSGFADTKMRGQCPHQARNGEGDLPTVPDLTVPHHDGAFAR